MASEARRGLVRMVANYVRLLASVLLGLLLVRLVIGGLGNDAWALVALLGSTVGIAAMLQDIIQASLVREIGTSWHSGDREAFRRTYNSALVLTTGVAALSLAAVLALLLLVPVLDIPEAYWSAARWMIVAKGLESFTMILLAAPYNMYRVSERMVLYNLWTVLLRGCPVVAAVILFLGLGIEDLDRGLKLYAVISSSLFVATLIVASVVMMLIDRSLVPAPRLANRRDAREILAIGGWNTAVVTALNLHVRADNIIMNLFFGLFGNLIFGLTTQLTAYVRQVTTGVTFGIDAVSVRLSSGDDPGLVHRLVHHMTRLQGLVAFPAGLGVFVLAEPLLLTWLGDRIQDPATTVPPTAMLVRVMTVGMTCRAVSDGWMSILYGAGHVRRYARLILAGGIANPVLAITLLSVLPESVRYTGAAAAYGAIFLVVHGILLPRVGARLLGTSAGAFFRPLVRPLLVTAVTAPALVLVARRIEAWTILHLLMVIGGYAALYLGVAAFVVFDGAERRRILAAIRRRLP